MHIAHINFSDGREGLGGTVRTLMDEQKSQGEDPVLFSFLRQTQDEDVFSLSSQPDAWQQSMSLFEKNEGVPGLSSGALLDLSRHPEYEKADLVHLHVATAS